MNVILLQLSVSIPIDLVKVRLQGQTTAERYRGSFHCVAEILRTEGPRGLFRGGVALALRDMPSYGFYFLPYELIRQALTETGQQPGQCQRSWTEGWFLLDGSFIYVLQTVTALVRRLSSGSFAIMTAGGVAGVLSWALATPMDVVKARLQMSEAGGQKYRGVLDCMRTSVREEGVRVFFKGVMLNSVRAFPVNAVTFLSYERLMKLLFSV